MVTPHKVIVEYKVATPEVPSGRYHWSVYSTSSDYREFSSEITFSFGYAKSWRSAFRQAKKAIKKGTHFE